jgi:hypothetical protein
MDKDIEELASAIFDILTREAKFFVRRIDDKVSIDNKAYLSRLIAKEFGQAVKAPKNELTSDDCAKFYELYKSSYKQDELQPLDEEVVYDFLAELKCPFSRQVSKAICSKFGSSGKRQLSQHDKNVLEEVYKYCLVAFDNHEEETHRAWKSTEFITAIKKLRELLDKEFSTAEVSEEKLEEIILETYNQADMSFKKVAKAIKRELERK